MAPSLVFAGLCALLLSASSVTGSPVHRRDCQLDWPAAIGETCEMMANDWMITVDHFIAINPGVQCPSLVHGQYYCVMWDGALPDPPTTMAGPTGAATVTQQPPVTTTAPGK